MGVVKIAPQTERMVRKEASEMGTKTLTLSKNMIRDTMVLEVPLPRELVSILGFAQAQTVQTIQELLVIGLYR